MSIKFYIQLLCKISALTVVCSLLINCSDTKIAEQNVVIVKVPPFYDDKLSDERNFHRFDRFLFPLKSVHKNVSESEIKIPKGIPNYDAILDVSIDIYGNIKLNMSEQGNVSDISQIQLTIEKIFNERKENGVYEPESEKIVKAVGIRAENSVKYKDFFKVIKAVEQSGADPIVLRFKDDAGNFENYFKK